jgi:hypothetical protein
MAILAQAKINKEWAIRLGAIGVLFLGFGAWFVYDGAVAWPEQQRIYKLFYEIDDEDKPTGRHTADYELHMKPENLRAEGLEPGFNPKDLKYRSDMDIMTQFIYAAICLPIGLASLAWLFVNARRPLFADDEGVTFGSRRLKYDQISHIDRSRWDNKGIAVLESESARSITLDDWKFKGATAVFDVVDRKLGGTPADEDQIN